MPESYCTIRGYVLLFRLALPYTQSMAFGSQAVDSCGWAGQRRRHRIL